jgi:S1-C subfamily serine protease
MLISVLAWIVLTLTLQQRMARHPSIENCIPVIATQETAKSPFFSICHNMNIAQIIAPIIAAISIIPHATAQSISQGTGVFINPDGHILTNRHVVESGCKSGLWIEDISGTHSRAKIVKVSRTLDIAILRGEQVGPHAYFRVNDARNEAISPILNESVHMVAFPENEFAARGGLVSSLQDPKHGRDGFAVGLQTTFGGSGGPVFDNSGLLIGITWGIRPSSDGSLRAYAVRASAIFPLLNEIRVGTATRREAPHAPSPGQHPLEHIQEIVGTGATVTMKVYCSPGR